MCAACCACTGFPPPSTDGGAPRYPAGGWLPGSSSPPQSVSPPNRPPTPSAPGILPEAAARLAAEAAGGHQVLEQRGRGQARVPELAVQHLLDRQGDVQPDDVQELERAHRVAAARLHGG